MIFKKYEPQKNVGKSGYDSHLICRLCRNKWCQIQVCRNILVDFPPNKKTLEKWLLMHKFWLWSSRDMMSDTSFQKYPCWFSSIWLYDYTHVLLYSSFCRRLFVSTNCWTISAKLFWASSFRFLAIGWLFFLGWYLFILVIDGDIFVDIFKNCKYYKVGRYMFRKRRKTRSRISHIFDWTIE